MNTYLVFDRDQKNETKNSEIREIRAKENKEKFVIP